jgi:hypothetical protein
MASSLTLLLVLAALALAASYRVPLRSTAAPAVSRVARANTALFGARNRAWAKGELSDEDIFGDDVADDGTLAKKQKKKLEPESVFFEGPPSPTEIILPAISILTILGIVPFISALSRQFWVRYKFTSRRISINSGIGGKDQTQIIYPDVEEIKFVYRAFGAAGDMVLFLKDGAKVELRHVPQFDEVYSFVLDKCDDDCKEKSMKLKAMTTATA